MDVTITPMEVDPLDARYPHVLLLYTTPPIGEIDLYDFEDLAFERLRVLRAVEQTNQIGHRKFSPEWRAALLGSLRQQRLRRYVRLLESTGDSAIDADAQMRQDDFISHFILRLAYCKTQDQRMWFVARELELFKMRFLNLSLDGVKSFFEANELNYQPIVKEEKDALKPVLIQSTVGVSLVTFENTNFFKLPFTEAPDLVRNRAVYIKKGYAYVPSDGLISCILSSFRTHLFKVLQFSNRRLPQLDDKRIIDLLKNLNASDTGREHWNCDTSTSLISVETLPILARHSFPICMRNMYDVTRNVHHLRHFGRVQFGLFLKGIGLNLEHAITYWKQEFCQLIDEETFNKKYLYNIRYNYGMQGNMVNHPPYGCQKIFSSDPSASDHHGCPFIHWDKEVLQRKILEYGVSTKGAREVVDLANKGNCELACTKYFMHTHNGVKPKEIITHPNQYFEESQKINPVQRKRIRKRKLMDTSENTERPNKRQKTEQVPNVETAEYIYHVDPDLSSSNDDSDQSQELNDLLDSMIIWN